MIFLRALRRMGAPEGVGWATVVSIGAVLAVILVLWPMWIVSYPVAPR